MRAQVAQQRDGDACCQAASCCRASGESISSSAGAAALTVAVTALGAPSRKLSRPSTSPSPSSATGGFRALKPLPVASLRSSTWPLAMKHSARSVSPAGTITAPAG